MPVYLDVLLTVQQYVPPPPDRFIEYEETDRSWLLYFGFARIEVVPDPTVYVLRGPGGPRLTMHPATLELLLGRIKIQGGANAEA